MTVRKLGTEISLVLWLSLCVSGLSTTEPEASHTSIERTTERDAGRIIVFPDDEICGNGRPPPNPNPIPTPTTNREGVKRYHVYHDQQLDFLGAWNACLRNGQRLASVTSAADAALLEETLGKVHRQSIYYIGGMKLGNDNRNWFWVSTNFTRLSGYTNWHLGQPDVIEERCLEIGRLAKWTWNDISCHALLHYICEE